MMFVFNCCKGIYITQSLYIKQKRDEVLYVKKKTHPNI